MIKLAIIRTFPSELNIDFYNVQEIGLAKSLLKYGVSTDFYSMFSNVFNETIHSTSNNNRLRLIPLKKVYKVGSISWFPGLFKSLFLLNKYDVVQVHEDFQLLSPLILRAAKQRKSKTVLVQGMYSDFGGFKKYIQKIYDVIFIEMLKRNTDCCIAKTSEAKKYLICKGFSNVNIIPVGLDITSFSYGTNFNQELHDFKNTHENILLYIGSIGKDRDIDFIIDVFKILLTKVERIGLILVGDGPRKDNIKMRIQKESLNNSILILDSVLNNKVGQIYTSADIFLLPSINEIFGMVVLESLYFGLPVVSSKTAGPLDILSNNLLGYCLDFDKNLWVDKILLLLKAQNDKFYKKKIVLTNFSWDVIARKYCEFYKR